MGRTDSLAKLAWAYGLHLTRRRLTRPRSQFDDLFDTSSTFTTINQAWTFALSYTR